MRENIFEFVLRYFLSKNNSKTVKTTLGVLGGSFIHILLEAQTICIWLVGMWAGPGGTAIPGQPVTEPEQAPELYPLVKISLISKGGHAPRIRY